jgi:hypothetical protein
LTAGNGREVIEMDKAEEKKRFLIVEVTGDVEVLVKRSNVIYRATEWEVYGGVLNLPQAQSKDGGQENESEGSRDR